MPDVALPADPPSANGVPPAEADPRPGTPFYVPISEDLAVRLRTDTVLDERLGRGELEQYRGEYVIATPDGTVLEHTTRDGDYSLINALDRATEKAVRMGIPPKQLTHYHVPPLE